MNDDTLVGTAYIGIAFGSAMAGAGWWSLGIALAATTILSIILRKNRR